MMDPLDEAVRKQMVNDASDDETSALRHSPVLADEALSGPLGEAVRHVEPTTEAVTRHRSGSPVG